MAKYSQEIEKLERELFRLKEQQHLFESQPPEHKLAITLHEIFCHYNHADQCGWEYEVSGGKTDWGGSSHSDYLGRARNVLHYCTTCNITPDTAIEIMKLSHR